MMAKIVLTLALLGVSQVFLTQAKPWGSDSHEIFYGPVRTFRLPAVASSVVAVPAWRSSALPAAAAPPTVAAAPPTAAAVAPAAPPAAAQAMLRSAPARKVGVSHFAFAFGGDDSRELGYDGGLDLSHEVGLVAFAPSKNQVW